MSEAAGRDKPSRIFLDSNVLFSGFHSPDGPPGAILKHFAEGRFVVVVSQQVLEEVVRTFKTKSPKALPALRDFLLNSPLEVVGDPGPEDVAGWTELLDEGDAVIIASAIAAEPDYFITGDSHFLENNRVKKKSGLEICPPSVLLMILGLERTA